MSGSRISYWCITYDPVHEKILRLINFWPVVLDLIRCTESLQDTYFSNSWEYFCHCLQHMWTHIYQEWFLEFKKIEKKLKKNSSLSNVFSNFRLLFYPGKLFRRFSENEVKTKKKQQKKMTISIAGTTITKTHIIARQSNLNWSEETLLSWKMCSEPKTNAEHQTSREWHSCNLETMF